MRYLEKEIVVVPFNRTSLELKQMEAGRGDAPGMPFNRTSLELKLDGLSGGWHEAVGTF